MPKRQPSRRSAEAGFTLVELLIVMSVILILITLAIPQGMKMYAKANETSAITSLRTLNQMQGQYNSTYPTHGFACTLASMGGKSGSPPSPEAAQLISEDLSGGHKSGYTFTMACGDKTTNSNVDQYNSYTILATPNSVGKSGNRGFCTDQNAEIRFDPKGGTNCTDILQ